jgi:hypothetical protein
VKVRVGLIQGEPSDAVIRRLFDGIDQAVQLDRGREGRMAAFAAADRPLAGSPSEQRAHLTDVEGFTRRVPGAVKVMCSSTGIGASVLPPKS